MVEKYVFGGRDEGEGADVDTDVECDCGVVRSEVPRDRALSFSIPSSHPFY